MVQKYDIVRITSDCPPESPCFFEGINTLTGLPVDYWVTDVTPDGSQVWIAPRDESFRAVENGPYEFSFDARMVTVTEPFTERDDLVLVMYKAQVLVNQPNRFAPRNAEPDRGRDLLTRDEQVIRGHLLEGVFGSQYWKPEILPAAYISDFRENWVAGEYAFIPLRSIMSVTNRVFIDHTEGAVRYTHPDPTFVLPSAPETEDEDEEEDF